MPMRSRTPAARLGEMLGRRVWAALPEALVGDPGGMLEQRALVALPAALPALPGEILEQRAWAALSAAPVVRQTPDRPRAT